MADGARDDVEHHGQREAEAQHPAKHHQDHFEPVERSPFQVMLPLQHQFVRDGHSSLFPSSQIKLAIGVGKAFGLPSLRTVRAVFPHTALQLLVSSSGMSRVCKGCCKGEQSLIREESVRPSLMVGFASSEPGPLVLLAQDGTQPPSNETIKVAKLEWRGVFEVTEPSPQRRVEIRDDP